MKNIQHYSVLFPVIMIAYQVDTLYKLKLNYIEF